jgi:hypothetical protein
MGGGREAVLEAVGWQRGQVLQIDLEWVGYLGAMVGKGGLGISLSLLAWSHDCTSHTETTWYTQVTNSIPLMYINI